VRSFLLTNRTAPFCFCFYIFKSGINERANRKEKTTFQFLKSEGVKLNQTRLKSLLFLYQKGVVRSKVLMRSFLLMRLTVRLLFPFHCPSPGPGASPAFSLSYNSGSGKRYLWPGMVTRSFYYKTQNR